MVRTACQAGVVGFLLKSEAAGKLVEILRAIMAGTRYLSPGLAGVAFDALHDSSLPDVPLTKREIEVLALVGIELSTKEIARNLAMKPRTVDSHRMDIMRKLDTHTVAGLVRYALRHGLARPE